MYKRLLFAAFAVIFAFPVAAASRIALVVGVSDYENITPLRNTVRDADLISARLERVGFEVTTLRNPSSIDLGGALRDFAFEAEVADIALLYYAGHGVEVDGRNFVLARDASVGELQDIAAQGFALDRLLSSAARSRKLRVVVLDSCRDNPFPAVDGIKRFAASTRSEQAQEAAERGTLVVYSTKDGTPALDGAGINSPFAQALADNLARPGVEIGMVFRRVRDQVIASTQGQQQPYTYGSLSGTPLFLAGAGEGESLSDEDKREAWAAIRPDDEVQLTALAEGGDVRSLIGLAYLRQDPNSERYDPAEAFDYLKRAAEAGSAEAQYELGRALEKGIGASQDPAEAIRWYRLAADQGFGDALNDLGYLYLQGTPALPRDVKRGIDLLFEAADAGHPEAMFNAAVLIDDGLVPGRSKEQAARYLYRAVRAGAEVVLNQLSEKPNDFSVAAREALQRILADNGFYDSGIDGDFGKGTKRGLRIAYGLEE